jgi:hypothetical protein
MKRLLSALLLIAAMSLMHAFALAAEVAGSTWSGSDIWGKPISLYFADDGSLVYKTSSGIWTTGNSWQLDESGIYFEMNKKFVEHKGTIHENEMRGEGWTKQGYKGNWSLIRQATNLEALVEAKASAQPAPIPPATLSPGEYQGHYEGTISFDANSLTVRFSCNLEKDCEIETTNIRGNSKPINSISRVKSVVSVSNWPGVQRAFQYARMNRADRPSSRENAAVQEKLRPLLDSNVSIEKCIDLNIGGANASILCRPSASPWKEAVLLLFSASLVPCGDGFCGYVMYPLLKK